MSKRRRRQNNLSSKLDELLDQMQSPDLSRSISKYANVDASSNKTSEANVLGRWISSLDDSAKEPQAQSSARSGTVQNISGIRSFKGKWDSSNEAQPSGVNTLDDHSNEIQCSDTEKMVENSTITGEKTTMLISPSRKAESSSVKRLDDRWPVANFIFSLYSKFVDMKVNLTYIL